MLEGLTLGAAFRVLGLVGASEMAHHQRELEGGEDIARFSDGLDLACRQPKPVHAAIDMDGGGEGAARRRREHAPLLDLLRAVEHRTQAMVAIERCRALEQSVEDIDDFLGQQHAEVPRLAERGDEEGLAAGERKRRSDHSHAEPIGVGFDHGGAFGRRAERGQAPVIGDQCIEVDGEDRRRGRLVDLRIAKATRDRGPARLAHSCRSGRRSSGARLPNLVYSGVNWSLTVPVGP